MTELNHNGPHLLGAVKTTGGRGGREGGKREEREGKVGKGKVKFSEGGVDSEVKGAGKKWMSQKKRRGEKPGEEDTREGKQRRKEGGENGGGVQIKIRQAVQSREVMGQTGKH